MLVLTRKEGESLVCLCGEFQIEVCVVRARGNSIRIGVTAPKNVKVLRQEFLKDADGQPRKAT